jgi:hypothetical protein
MSLPARKAARSIPLFLFIALAGCGHSESQPAAGPPVSNATVSTSAAQAAEPAAPTPSAEPVGLAAPILIAGPGFQFQPVRGTAGGSVDGVHLGEGCVGHFPSTPQHTLQVGASIPRLRVLVNGGVSTDTTLAVRTPSGQTLCNDDSGDPGNYLNPVVEIENPAPGLYQVFVGNYSNGESSVSYQLGVVETQGLYPSQGVPHP